jgi:hypothetical protein
VPNIRYRPNIRQYFLAEYSFSAETRKSVFGRSLGLAHNNKTCYSTMQTLFDVRKRIFS